MPTTTGMKGGGYYDAHSKEQRAALVAFLPWLEQAIPSIAVPSGHETAFRLMDVGSSEGANAIYAMIRLIKRIRIASDVPISEPGGTARTD